MTTYDLSIQNRCKSDEVDVENLLAKLLDKVNTKPDMENLFKNKKSQTHKLFCKLLTNLGGGNGNNAASKENKENKEPKPRGVDNLSKKNTVKHSPLVSSDRFSQNFSTSVPLIFPPKITIT